MSIDYVLNQKAIEEYNGIYANPDAAKKPGAPKYRIAAYVRNFSPEYSVYLAQSVHLGISCDYGSSYSPLYREYGVLFPKCAYNSENGIISTGVVDLRIFLCGDIYVITGSEIERRQVKEGIFMKSCEERKTGWQVRWLTRDFISFSEPVRHKSGIPDGVKIDVIGSSLECRSLDICSGDAVEIGISEDIAIKLLEKNIKVEFKKIELPICAEVKSREDIEKISAKVIYTDGSTHEKRVKWNLDSVDFSKPGEYEITGKVQIRRFPFPVEERAWGDPIITYYEGKYYFIGTDDWEGNKKFEVRCADCPEELFKESTPRSVILSSADGRWDSTFWAPEFHIAGGRLYIFCTLGKGSFNPQSHVMRLRKGGNIMNPADWEDPVRCVMPDGRYLSINPLGDGKNGITLDMTYFEVKNRGYAVWSYRTWAGTDSGSMLMLAEVDPENPWQLLTYPKLLSRPEFGWENIDGTDNNEGPFPIVTDDKIYLSYSGGNASGDTYVVGMITADVDSDLTDISSWHKSHIPYLASNFVKGQYGCGHNGFFEDEFGDTYITYHGHKTIGNSARIDGIRRVHFDKNGVPVLYMTDEQDLPESKQDVKIKVRIEK